MSQAVLAGSALEAGTWNVDPQASTVGFVARGLFGLTPVRGTFAALRGVLEADGDGARGTLELDAASVDTANARRDTHLRSAAFFDAEASPVVSFELTELAPDGEGTLRLSGVLGIRGGSLPVEAPVSVVPIDTGKLRLDTTFSVDRAAAGVGWGKFGMIRAKVQLTAAIVLIRD